MTLVLTQEYPTVIKQQMQKQPADEKIKYKYYQEIVLLTFFAKLGATITLTNSDYFSLFNS